MDPQAELNLSNFRRAQNVPAEVLYRAGWNESQNRVYQHYSDERVLVTEDQQLELPFITQESYDRLRAAGFQHLHLGMIMIRVHTLHRREAGVNILVALRDTRWRDDRSIISTMEMDLTAGVQLAYSAPDMMISIHDFRDHIQLVLQTHGYENWQGGESNLIISRSLIGRLSNNAYTRFQYNVQNVADHVASHGVQAIPGNRYSTAELRHRNWIIRGPEVPQIQHPQDASITARSDGTILLQFTNYGATKASNDTHVGSAGEDELTDEELIAFLSDEETHWEIEVPDEATDEDDFLSVLQTLASIPDETVAFHQSTPLWDDYGDDKEEWINPFSLEGGGSSPAYVNGIRNRFSPISNPTIPLFKGENYEFWSIKMRMMLKSHGLWELVETGTPNPDLAPIDSTK